MHNISVPTPNANNCIEYYHRKVVHVCTFNNPSVNKNRGKKAVSSPLDPWQTCSFRHQLDFSGKHSAMLQLLQEDYSLARYSNLQPIELGCRGENENV